MRTVCAVSLLLAVDILVLIALFVNTTTLSKQRDIMKEEKGIKTNREP